MRSRLGTVAGQAYSVESRDWKGGGTPDMPTQVLYCGKEAARDYRSRRGCPASPNRASDSSRAVVQVFQHISQEHRGEEATLELSHAEPGKPVIAACQRFRMIVADEDYGLDRVTIVMEGASGNAILHTLTKAAQVRFADAMRSAHSTLSIATVSGTAAVLRFRQSETAVR